ncbi:MAG TPA: PLDc N-terminal domain-containing protein [Thermomicrobiaceae bacterium]|nr:PLDc N-terminal domain-containing protein [Thermomicrobiaceae bacterium]
MQNLRGLAWLLPTTSLIFVGYVVFAFLGALSFGLPIWLILLPSLPALGLTAIALVVALLDVTKRPKEEISEESRIVWVLVLIIFPVVGLLPYWLVVMRHPSAAA